MKVTLGITPSTTYEEFLWLMRDRDLWTHRNIELSTEEYAIVAEKFVHRDDCGRDLRGPMCWRAVIFRPTEGEA